MVKYSVPGLPTLIDTEINLIKSRRELSRALYNMAFSLKFRNPVQISKSISSSLKVRKRQITVHMTVVRTSRITRWQYFLPHYTVCESAV